MKAAVDIPDEGSRGALLTDGQPAPPWFGLARKHLGNAADPDLDAVRTSIARGWAHEMAESEAALRKPHKR